MEKKEIKKLYESQINLIKKYNKDYYDRNNPKVSDQEYDKPTCKHLIEQIQSMALAIAHDNQGDEIKTEMEYKDVQDSRV